MSEIAIPRTKSRTDGKTLTMRDVIGISLEALAGDLIEWAHFNRAELEQHVVWFTGDYALKRGVILDPNEILHALHMMLIEMNVIADPSLADLAPKPDFDI